MPERVRDVELALRVVRLEPLERAARARPRGRRRSRSSPPGSRSSSAVASRAFDDAREAAVARRGRCARTARGSRGSKARIVTAARSRRCVSTSALEQLGGEQRGVAVEDEHVAVEAVERARARRGRRRPSRAASPAPRPRPRANASRVSGEATTTSGSGAARRAAVDHPVDQAPAEQRVEVLRQARVHPGAEAAGHDDAARSDRASWTSSDGWGARIRTWDRGTKTRCLTAWLRPTAASPSLE